jgi:hypothetical protein
LTAVPPDIVRDVATRAERRGSGGYRSFKRATARAFATVYATPTSLRLLVVATVFARPRLEDGKNIKNTVPLPRLNDVTTKAANPVSCEPAVLLSSTWNTDGVGTVSPVENM